ncbi:SRPBCC family protein [Devosia sp.]|uniref:SRPBCC family protein n=1 Tax=Devosia sp. TaxID=1871048 RepID=UPI002FCB1160
MRRLFGSLVLGSILMATTMEGAMAETLNLTVTRVIDAPAEVVWRALTEAEAIKQWWGPQGFTAPIVETDVRVGGATLVCMTAPGFPMMCNSWTYTELLSNERIAFDNGWVDESGKVIDPASMGLPPDIPTVVPHVLELKPMPDGKTELSWSEFGYASAETVALSKMGLESVLDKLVASLR